MAPELLSDWRNQALYDRQMKGFPASSGTLAITQEDLELVLAVDDVCEIGPDLTGLIERMKESLGLAG